MRLGAAGDGAGKVGMLEQAGHMGSADALYELAKVYQQDTIVAKDLEQSVVYLTRAHGLGNMEAARVLGWLYIMGQGVPKDVEYGKMLLEDASKTSVRAMREYGQILTNLRPPHLNDPARGISYLRDAVARGDSESVPLLATALERQGDHAGAAAVRQQVYNQGIGVGGGAGGLVTSTSQPEQASTPKTPSPQIGSKVEMSAETMKQRAFAGDVEAIYNYALNVAIRRYPSLEPEFDSYCWYSTAAKLGHKQAEHELVALQGVRVQYDQKEPGRIDECVAGLLEVVGL